MTVCRACMIKTKRMESVFSPIHQYNTTLSDIFTGCTSLGVMKNDGLPEYLCYMCIKKLKEWFAFKEMCLKSHEKFHFDLNTGSVSAVSLKSLCSDENLVVELQEGELEGFELEENPKLRKENTKEVIKPSDSPYCIVVIEEKDKPNDSKIIKEEDNLNKSSNDDRVNDAMCTEGFNPINDHTYACNGPHSMEKQYYYCKLCLKIFTDVKDLQYHINSVHPGVLECEFCGKDFNQQLELLQHLPFCDKNYKRLNDDINDEVNETIFEEIEKQEEQQLNENGQNSTKSPNSPKKQIVAKTAKTCTICSKTLVNKYKLNLHMLRHTGERPHMCHVCGRCFAQTHSLQVHSAVHTGVKNWICEMCGKRYATLYGLRCHMRTHQEIELKHRCTYCPKTFYGRHELQNHLRLHTGERPFECSICSKGFRLKQSMKTHYERHACLKENVIKPYTCSNCNKSFVKVAGLQKHQSKCHKNKEKPTQNDGIDNKKGLGEAVTFKCHMCNKQFRTERNLKTHLFRHTSNRPFVCTVCYRNFKDTATLEAHLRFHARPKPFQCEICSKRFIDRSALRSHIRTHTGEKPFECEICSKRFTANMSLKAHMRSHTGEKPFKCSICHRLFSQKCSLQTHMLTIHRGEV